jgi:predicted Zn finger-like uncharacterized protein
MNVACSHCHTAFRVDPGKVPEGGVRARCSVCRGVFPVQLETDGGSTLEAAAMSSMAAAGASASTSTPEPQSTGATVAPPTAPPREDSQPQASDAAAVSAPAVPRFGAQDPHSKARRLARALVSDMVIYHPERQERGLREDTLRKEFKEEIRKSWEEFVEQVGRELAHGTPYFRDALNEILARGKTVF